jgi:uncharacterized integral membrane protein
MIRKILFFLIAVPVAILIVALSVANRHPVVLSYDPLGGGDDALSVRLPLFAIILGALLIGVVAGGAAAWWNQGKWRRTARQGMRDAARWHNEAEALRRSMEETRVAALPKSDDNAAAE